MSPSLAIRICVQFHDKFSRPRYLYCKVESTPLADFSLLTHFTSFLPKGAFTLADQTAEKLFWWRNLNLFSLLNSMTASETNETTAAVSGVDSFIHFFAI